MAKFELLLILLAVTKVELKYFGGDNILKSLIAYNSESIKKAHEIPHEYNIESFYYSPYQSFSEDKNFSINFEDEIKLKRKSKAKRGADTTFKGKPKSKQEVWARNFNFTSQEFKQTTSLVVLLNKIITKYMTACIPVVLYDDFVETSEGFIVQRLLSEFPVSFIHGKIGKNHTIDKELLQPADSKCRSYILFVSDALRTRQIIGAQIVNKVLVVPRSTQWKLQEFLSSPLSRDIINLLVIGESYSADRTRERPYVLYTHQLYIDGLGSNKPKVLTSWIKGKLSRPHIDLFPPKLTKGFAGHRFSVAASNFPPFVFKILKTDGVGNVQIKWDGYEYRLLQALGQRLNFTFDVTEPKNQLELG